MVGGPSSQLSRVLMTLLIPNRVLSHLGRAVFHFWHRRGGIRSRYGVGVGLWRPMDPLGGIGPRGRAAGQRGLTGGVLLVGHIRFTARAKVPL